MPQSRHILEPFNAALETLRTDALAMAAVAERNLDNALKGLFLRDENLLRAVIADDEDVDQFEKQVDEDGINILLRFQPLATDLRNVVSAMKLVADLERVGDQAVNIARKARKLCAEPQSSRIRLLEPVSELALALFRDAVRAYANGDVQLALSIKQRDKELDQLNADLSERLTEEITRSRVDVRVYLAMIHIGRHLERVGDHAKNIAEDAVFAASAADIRHLHGDRARL